MLHQLTDELSYTWIEKTLMQKPSPSSLGEIRIHCITHFLTEHYNVCLLYTSPSPRDGLLSRMPSSA